MRYDDKFGLGSTNDFGSSFGRRDLFDPKPLDSFSSSPLPSSQAPAFTDSPLYDPIGAGPIPRQFSAPDPIGLGAPELAPPSYKPADPLHAGLWHDDNGSLCSVGGQRTGTWQDPTGMYRDSSGNSVNRWVDNSGMIRDCSGNTTGQYVDPMGFVKDTGRW